MVVFNQNTNLLISFIIFIVQNLYKQYPIKIIEKPCYYTVKEYLYIGYDHKHCKL